MEDWDSSLKGIYALSIKSTKTIYKRIQEMEWDKTISDYTPQNKFNPFKRNALSLKINPRIRGLSVVNDESFKL